MPLPKPQANNRKARKREERRARASLPPAPRPEVKTVVSTSPVPVVSDMDIIACDRWRDLLPKWEDLTEDEQRRRTPFCEAVSSLFFSGGKLSDHGITVKPGIELRDVMRYLRATMGDWGPSHEHKIGGIGHMLAKWCDHKGK